MMKVIKDELPGNFMCYFFDSNLRPDIVRVTLQEEEPKKDKKFTVYFHLPVFVGDAVPHSVNILLDIFKCVLDLYDIKLSGAQWTALETKLYDVLTSYKGV